MGKKSTGSQSFQSLQDYLSTLNEGETPDSAILKQIAENEPNGQQIDLSAIIKTVMESAPQSAKGLNAEELRDLKIQAHGLTVGQMKALKEKQALKEVEMMPANKVSRYKIPVHEKNFVHFSLERVTYKENTDIRTSRPTYHVKTVSDFEKMSKVVREPGDKISPENAFRDYDVVILHDPRSTGPAPKLSEKTYDERLEEMTEAQLRHEYKRLYEEDALPSDNKSQLKDMIKEKIAENKSAA